MGVAVAYTVEPWTRCSEVDFEIGLSIDVILFGTSKMEIGLLQERTLAFKLRDVLHWSAISSSKTGSSPPPYPPRSPARRVWSISCSANAQRRQSQSRESTTVPINNQGGE